jgi:predicted dienelactone hydrolase
MQIRPRLFLSICALGALAVLAEPDRASGSTCRSGSETLADERALVSFRAALEEACPCDDYDGSPGRDVSAYRDCADVVLNDALAEDAIRPDCERPARAVYEGAVCGSDGVPCVRSLGSASASCRIEPEERCKSRRGLLRLPRVGATVGGRARRIVSRLGSSSSRQACPSSSSCADVSEWGAGTCIDVRADGPYGRGVHFVTLTKPSAVDESQQREIRVAIWYPAPAGAGPVDEQRRAVVDAPLDLQGGPYPLVLFSHGSCGYAEQSLFLTPYLASHGFVVVAPDHTGNTIFDFPDCGSGPVQASSFIERPEDIRFALDYVLAANADSDSFLHRAIDPSRLGMSGHSFGGLTTYLVEAADPRIGVAVPLAAAVPGEPELQVPSLTVLGEIDSVVDNDRIREAYARARSPKYLVGIGDAGHYAFSDGCFTGPDCDAPRTRSQAEANELVRRWVLPFLKVYLTGDESFAPFLVTSPPGTELESD